jgi:uncharacterized membrane protein
MSGVDAYWGDQPFVGGPMYSGAVIMFFFVMSLFLVKGPLKRSLVIATVVTIMLSWGGNFTQVTDFFVDYFPMYNKFRAVASIQIVALFAIPLLATMMVHELVANPNLIKEKWVLFGKETKYTN